MPGRTRDLGYTSTRRRARQEGRQGFCGRGWLARSERTVVYQDIIIGPALAEVARALNDMPPTIIVLCPDPAAIAAREAARPKQGYADAEAILALDRALRGETPRLGHWLDTTTLTVAETVDQILALLP